MKYENTAIGQSLLRAAVEQYGCGSRGVTARFRDSDDDLLIEVTDDSPIGGIGWETVAAVHEDIVLAMHGETEALLRWRRFKPAAHKFGEPPPLDTRPFGVAQALDLVGG